MEGIFRLSGSSKRIKDLQLIFNSPERYGKGLDWTGYTVHDAANILRRYLNQLPEPIVPLDFYERFRDPLRTHQAQAVGDMEAQMQDAGDFDHDRAVITYQRLITELPPLNRQLLLYILDLLAVFSSKSDLNRMNAANLAAIFQPGIISHPQHDMAPAEYRLSQNVLIFLIENQDNFLIGMTGTAVDEKTVKELQGGAIPTQSNKANVGRSASNASAGADSLRKFGGVRRNVSVSSKNSRGSGNAPSPVTPSTGVAFASNSTGSSLNRSNTLPSKRSPGLASGRFGKPSEPSTPTSTGATPPVSSMGIGAATVSTPTQELTPTDRSIPRMTPILNHTPPAYATNPTGAAGQSRPEQSASQERRRSQEKLSTGMSTFEPPQNTQTPVKERKLSNLFAKPLQTEAERTEARQPNRLRKKQRIPGTANESAQSSQNSLHGDSPMTPAFHTPLMSPEANIRSDPMASLPPTFANTVPTPTNEDPPQQTREILHGHGHGHGYGQSALANEMSSHQNQTTALRPAKSPEPSIRSRSSATDHSDFDQMDDPRARAEKRRHRWRISSSANKNDDEPLAPPPQIGSNARAGFSNSSLGSSSRPRKSFTGDSQQLGTDQSNVSSMGYPSTIPYTSQESEPERKGGLFGKLKAKREKAKEEKKERELEKERAKSPGGNDVERGGSRQSLSAYTQDLLPHRGRSMEQPRDWVERGVVEPPRATDAAHQATAGPPRAPNQAPYQ